MLSEEESTVYNRLKKIISIAIEQAGFTGPFIFSIEHPKNEQFGDYSTNAALMLAKRFNLSPQEVAEKIIQHIKKCKGSKFIKNVKFLKGFINFELEKGFFVEELKKVVKEGDYYGSNNVFKGKKVLVEYTDVNPFKEFHIGHLFSNTVGECIARLFEKSGAVVKRACYQGDVGLHIGKAIWGMKKIMEESKMSFQDLYRKSLKEKVALMGKAYAVGSRAYKEEKNAVKKIREYTKLCYLISSELWSKKVNMEVKKEYGDDYKEIRRLYLNGRKWSLEDFERIYKILGTKFDFYFFESETSLLGKKYVEKYLKKGIFKKSKGAIIYDGEKKGLHTRVFVNSAGLPTYEAKDLGLAVIKYKKFPYDVSFIITGNEVNEYFRVVFSALADIFPKLAERTKHIGHGMLRLPEGKVSSRKGNIISADWLIAEVINRLKDVVSSANKNVKISQSDLQRIAVGAIKYTILKNNIRNDVVFDFDKSLSLDGNSGPYIQYTYTRCLSILRKAKGDKFKNLSGAVLREAYNHPAEHSLLIYIYRFPEIVRGAVRTIEPQRICNFLFNLSRRFSVFYEKVPVLNEENLDIKKSRLLLVSSVAQIIKNGLGLLGIDTVEKM